MTLQHERLPPPRPLLRRQQRLRLRPVVQIRNGGLPRRQIRPLLRVRLQPRQAPAQPRAPRQIQRRLPLQPDGARPARHLLHVVQRRVQDLHPREETEEALRDRPQPRHQVQEPLADPADKAGAPPQSQRPREEPDAHAERGAGPAPVRPPHVPGRHQADQDRDAPLRPQLYLRVDADAERPGAVPGGRRLRHRQRGQRRRVDQQEREQHHGEEQQRGGDERQHHQRELHARLQLRRGEK